MAYTPKNANGQATMANSSPVVIASNQSALTTANPADSIATGTIVAAAGVVNTPVVAGMAGWTMAYYGTYATGASLTMEVSFDGGTTYVTSRMLAGSTSTLGYVQLIAAVSNSTAFFTADIPAGATHLQVRCSAWAAPTGTINVIIGQSKERFASPNGAISLTAGTLTTLTNITNWGNIVDDAAFTPGTTRVSANGYFADETATDSVDEGDMGAARMTLDRKQIVSTYAHAAGGYTPGKLVSAASTNATVVKASAGTIGYISVGNVNAAARYLKIYDKATSPTVGTDVPVHTFIIPGNAAGAGTNIMLPPQGISCSNGIAFALTVEPNDSGTTAVAASEITVNYGTK